MGGKSDRGGAKTEAQRVGTHLSLKCLCYIVHKQLYMGYVLGNAILRASF